MPCPVSRLDARGTRDYPASTGEAVQRSASFALPDFAQRVIERVAPVVQRFNIDSLPVEVDRIADDVADDAPRLRLDRLIFGIEAVARSIGPLLDRLNTVHALPSRRELFGFIFDAAYRLGGNHRRDHRLGGGTAGRRDLVSDNRNDALRQVGR